MNKPIIIDGCNVVKERKFLIHTDKYSIGEDGLIDNTIPLTDICYELALQLQRLKAENKKLKEENIEIKEDEIMQRIINIELMQKWDENSEDYKKRVLEYMKKMRY